MSTAPAVFSAETKDYGWAIDLGVRMATGGFAVVRMDVNDTPANIAEKLRRLALYVEQLEKGQDDVSV